jgi:osmotically-inducible protein OsmY
VSAALADSHQRKYFEGVNVETFKDVVQLSGFVNTRDLKDRAGDIARDAAGGREVRNNITVKE